MDSSNPGPWNFSNTDGQMVSPDGQHRIEYGALYEIAMGAPVGGNCFLVYPDRGRHKLSTFAGGPPVWETSGRKVAFPVWTDTRDQKMAVADLDARTLTVYQRLYRVLALRAFENGIIRGTDSPIHMPREIAFDRSREKPEKVWPIR